MYVCIFRRNTNPLIPLFPKIHVILVPQSEFQDLPEKPCVQISVFKVTLAYKVSSKSDRATQKNHISEKKKKRKKKEKEEKKRKKKKRETSITEVKSCGKSFLGAQRSCVPEIDIVLARKLGNHSVSTGFEGMK